MGKKENSEGLLKAIRLFLAVMPFVIGGFHVWGSALASVFTVVCLFILYRKNGHLSFSFDPVFTACLVLEGVLLISPLWAVDSGMAVFGFVKFLPLPLFCILLMQCKSEDPISYLTYIPYSGAVMVVVSFVLSRIPALTSFFTVYKRQAGFFQYSNTYALFLLMGVCILLFKREKSILELVLSVLLMVGVLLSGSRTVFILMGALMLVYIIWEKNRKIKISLASALVLLVLAAGGYAFFTKNYDTVGRYLTSSLSSSTFIGRFLYYRDALPVIFSHPFGLGYGGYKSLQGSFQTGVYSVVHIHNDYLQMLLDAGWVPFGFSVFALIKSLRKGNA
ncbi:MAG: O-antigen ligase family protein, partial [Clostridiales bacterium]|nr:O-antigen ligase family protein [Clostridiales bacterium]